MNEINLLLIVASVLILSLSFFAVVLVHRKKKIVNWESEQLGSIHELSKKDAHDVIAGKLALEDVDADIWKLVVEHGIDYKSACQVRSGQMNFQSLLSENEENFKGNQKEKRSFIFDVKPVRVSSNYFELKEMNNEPSAFINASKATVWLFSTNGTDISHLVLAGHANGPVCRQLSSLLLNTYLLLDNIEECIFVPGACLLINPSHISKIDIRLPAPIWNSGMRLEVTRAKSVNPLQRVVADLKPFVDDTGLANIYFSNAGKSYEQYQDELREVINKYRAEEKNVLVRLSPKENVQAFFAPYYLLNSNELEVLSIELPMEIFKTEDFIYLKEIHQRALLLEITDDALRRELIYKEWLRKDTDDFEKFRYVYERMSQPDREAQRVYISGTRDYLSASIKQTSGDVKENYISAEEHFTKNLPALIDADNYWIGQMRKLLEDINRHDRARDKRLEDVNVATLIDSFLRGWASVFLASEEGRRRYDAWCKEKREVVWKAIFRQMRAKFVQMSPLSEDNTVFQVRIAANHVQIIPFHLITDDSMMFISRAHGIPYYIDNWQRRDVGTEPIQPQMNNLQKAKHHFEKAEELLDSDTGNDINLITGVEELELALGLHPIFTAQSIWAAWWKRYSRDTSREFEIFKNLMRGIQAYQEEDYSTSIAHLRDFIRYFPEHLPDPYLLITVNKLQKKFDVLKIIKHQRELQLNYKTLVEDHNKKVGFLDSNKGFLQQFHGQGMQMSPGEQKQFKDILRISEEVKWAKQQIGLLDRQLGEVAKSLNDRMQLVWEEISNRPDPMIIKARELDSAYVEKAISTKKIELSQQYWTRFRPLHEILNGDEYVQIAEILGKASIDLGKGALSLDGLMKIVENCKNIKYLQSTDINSLTDFGNKLSTIGEMDVIIRELMLKKELDQIAQNYFQKGLFMYEQSAYLLPEFTEPVKRLISLYAQYRLQYKKSLAQMINAKIPIRNFSPKGRFTIICQFTGELRKVWLDTKEKLICGEDNSGNYIHLISVDGLSEEDACHLEAEISRDGFLSGPRIGLNASERILNSPINPSPKSRRWSQACTRLEKMLIAIIAYTGIIPLPDNPTPNQNVMDAFDRRPAIVRVDADREIAQGKFLRGLDLSESDFLIVDLD